MDTRKNEEKYLRLGSIDSRFWSLQVDFCNGQLPRRLYTPKSCSSPQYGRDLNLTIANAKW